MNIIGPSNRRLMAFLLPVFLLGCLLVIVVSRLDGTSAYFSASGSAGLSITAAQSFQQPATLSLSKVCEPETDGGSFTFTVVDNGTQEPVFTGESLPCGWSTEAPVSLAPGSYTLTETMTFDAETLDDYLTAIDCGDKGASNSASIVFSVGEAEVVSCQVTNVVRAGFSLQKEVVGVGDLPDDALPDDGFPFAITSTMLSNEACLPSNPLSFTLGHNDSVDCEHVPPGELTFFEDLTGLEGWNTAIDCRDGSNQPIGEVTGTSVTLTLAPAGTISCTFTNTYEPPEEPPELDIPAQCGDGDDYDQVVDLGSAGGSYAPNGAGDLVVLGAGNAPYSIFLGFMTGDHCIVIEGSSVSITTSPGGGDHIVWAGGGSVSVVTGGGDDKVTAIGAGIGSSVSVSTDGGEDEIDAQGSSVTVDCGTGEDTLTLVADTQSLTGCEGW